MQRAVWMLVGVATIGAILYARQARSGPDEIGADAAGDRLATTSPFVAAAGRVEPVSEERAVGVEVVGRVRRVLVDEGDVVAAGDLLAELDNDDHRARQASAEARLAVAEAEYSRLVNGARDEERREADAQRRQAEVAWTQAATEHERRARLYAQGAIALEEAERADRDARLARARLDEAIERAQFVGADARQDDRARARAAIALARASVDEARALVAKTQIRSPEAGVVVRRHRLAGELVSPETGPLFVVADTSRLRVRAEVDETDIARLLVGQLVSVRADAYGERRFEGRVSRIGQSLGRKTLRADRPTERVDTAVLETLVDLAPGTSLPLGLRVDVFIATPPPVTTPAAP